MTEADRASLERLAPIATAVVAILALIGGSLWLSRVNESLGTLTAELSGIGDESAAANRYRWTSSMQHSWVREAELALELWAADLTTRLHDAGVDVPIKPPRLPHPADFVVR